MSDNSRFSLIEIDDAPARVPAKAPSPVKAPILPPLPLPVTVVPLAAVAAALAAPVYAPQAEAAPAAPAPSVNPMFARLAAEEAARAAQVPLPLPTGPAPVVTSAPAEPLTFDITLPPGFRAVTSGGATMSARMARCYGYLAKCSIPIRDFSTDETVRRALSQLEGAIATVRAATNRGDRVVQSGATYGAFVLRELLADLEGLARRVPAARVQNAPTVQGQAPAVQTAPVAAQALAQALAQAAQQVQARAEVSSGLIAVAVADETTGAVTYWRLAGEIEIAKLRAAWLAEGLDAAMLCEPASAEVALRRAVQELQARSVLIRQHPAGGWALVHERRVGDTLRFDVGARVYIADGDGALRVEPGEGESQQSADALAVQLRAAYVRHQAQVASQDVSVWLVKLAAKLHAVALRDRGGIYFVPRDGVPMLRQIKRALAACSSHAIHEIPALKSSEALAAILDAISTEAQSEIATIEGELAAGDLGARAARSRIDACDTLAQKVGRYEKLLGRQLGDVRARLSALRVKLSAVTSRTSNLEIV